MYWGKLRPLLGRAYRKLRGGKRPSRPSPPRLVPVPITSRADYERWAGKPAEEPFSPSTTGETKTILTEAYCIVCRDWRALESSLVFARSESGQPRINWREHLLCPQCQLNNRMRASLHLLEECGGLSPSARVYATEQVTPLYRALQKRFPHLVGSEWLGSAVARGHQNAQGVRNEDITQLSFRSGEFDAILSFDVFEHVPDHRAALRECWRTLKPGGLLLFSVPFDPTADRHVVRARLDPARDVIEHLLPPEYHGDPLNPAGCLAFRKFGWDVLGELKDAGFSTASALCYYSPAFGYLGGDCVQFAARK